MRTFGLWAACALLVPALGNVASADVDGQTFYINVSSTYSGNFDAELTFDGDEFFLDAEGGEGGEGTYTQFGTGALVLIVADGDNGDEYEGSFFAISFDAKQLGGILGTIAQNNETPAVITGRGSGNVVDFFRFEGEEDIDD